MPDGRSCSATGTPASSSCGTATPSRPSPRRAARRGARSSAPTARSTSPRAATSPAAATPAPRPGIQRVTADGRSRRSPPRSPAMRSPARTTSRSAPTAASGSPTRAPRWTIATTPASRSGSTCWTPPAAARWCSSCPASTRTASPSTPRAASTGRSRGPPRAPARRRRADHVLPAARQPRARRHGVRRRRPAVRVQHDAEGVTVLSPDGEILEEITIGEHATNCIFDGPTLWVTATKVADIEASQRTGTFWRIETDATGGLPLITGPLERPTPAADRTRSPLRGSAWRRGAGRGCCGIAASADVQEPLARARDGVRVRAASRIRAPRRLAGQHALVWTPSWPARDHAA